MKICPMKVLGVYIYQYLLYLDVQLFNGILYLTKREEAIYPFISTWFPMMAMALSMPSVSNLNSRRNIFRYICYSPWHIQFHIKWLEIVISFSNSTCIVENLKCSLCFPKIAKSVINWRSYFRFWRCWGLIGGCFNQCTQSDFCILNEFVIIALIWTETAVNALGLIVQASKHVSNMHIGL